MRLSAQLVEVGRSAARVLREQESWVHRRVESLTFPIPDEQVYRRHISIDFSIPPGLKPIDHGVPGRRSPRYYVPLSIIRKWPPLDRLDLRGEDGRSIPFLTGRQNQLLDAASLVQMADDLTAATDTAEAMPLTNEEERQVARIALSRGAEAVDAFSAVCPPFGTSPTGTVSQAIERLRADEAFVGLAQLLRLNTILWLRTEGEAEDREIVKFSYDIPWDAGVIPFGLAAFGLAPFVFEFETPHVGSTGSYHLNLAAPPPLRTVDSELVLYEDSGETAADQAIDPGKVKHQVSPEHPIQMSYDGFEAFADVAGRRAKFYISGKRHGLAGRVYVAVRLDILGFLRSASLGATLIATLLGAFAAEPSQVAKNNAAAAAVLLVVPALLAYLLPSEQVLLRGLLAGLRRIAVLGGTWPLIASALVVILSGEAALRWSLAGLASLEALTALGLALPLVQGWWMRKRKGSSKTSSARS
jgi:hypothetical protein